MKKKLLLAVGVASFLLSSCTVYTEYTITGKPIGTKTGVAKSRLGGSGDYSLETAAKDGRIKTIGAVQIEEKWFLVPIVKTTVYGE